MKQVDDIEKLFKNTFENFESNVDANVWSNIQKSIKHVSPNSSSLNPKLTVGKIVLGIASVVIITGSIWYLASSKDSSKNVPAEPLVQTANSTSPKEIKQSVIAGAKPAINSESPDKINSPTPNQIPTVVRSANDYSSRDPKKIQAITDASSNDKPVPDGSTSEHASSQPVSHKYGKSSDAPTSLMRGNNTTQKASKKNNVEELHSTEQTPNANILASSESGDAPLNVVFSNQGPPSSLTWDFGDGNTSRENTPSHTYKKPGNYIVHLTSKNSLGNSSDKTTIEVKTISGIEHTPNIFSPNDDGENDLFFLGLKNISSIEVVISDLNGHIVGGWNSLDGSWNGKLKNGDDAAEGLYFYTVEAMGTDGVNHTQKGSISLSRQR